MTSQVPSSSEIPLLDKGMISHWHGHSESRKSWRACNWYAKRKSGSLPGIQVYSLNSPFFRVPTTAFVSCDLKQSKSPSKGMTDDEMVGWHHWLNGHEFEQTPEDGEGQGSLACCSPWGCKESNTTKRLNNNKISFLLRECRNKILKFPKPLLAQGKCEIRHPNFLLSRF